MWDTWPRRKRDKTNDFKNSNLFCIYVLGNNPGMGHRPLILDEGALIWYKANDTNEIKKYVDNIDQFLAREYLVYIGTGFIRLISITLFLENIKISF